MGWKEFVKWMDEPIGSISFSNVEPIIGKHYICKDCEYIWTSKKSVGSPCKCPDCGSRNIEEC